MITRIKPKQVNGQELNGSMLVELAANYIEVINSGDVPVIENIWNCVQKNEQERVFKEAFGKYQDACQNFQSSADISEELKKAKEQAAKFLQDHFLGDKKQLEVQKKKLKQKLKEEA